MNQLDYISGASGGLSYHAAAFRNRRQLWRPFIETVDSWISQNWQPQSKHLIIFGPSAGWTLSIDSLNKFESVVCVEPDPIARFLFRRRFKDLKKLDFESRASILPWFSKRESEFGEFLKQHPHSAILFSNLLGQIPLLTKKDLRPGQKELLTQLGGREWASYHDLLSAPAPVRETWPDRLVGNEDSAQLASTFFSEGAEVIDHETLWLSRGRTTNTAIWQIRPGVNHVIGFVKG